MKRPVIFLASMLISAISYAQYIKVWPTLVENNISMRVFSNSLEEYLYEYDHFYDDFDFDSVADDEYFVLDEPEYTYEPKEMKVCIYDATTGKLIKPYKIKESFTYTEIYLGYLKQGIYILVIEFENIIHTQKFFKL